MVLTYMDYLFNIPRDVTAPAMSVPALVSCEWLHQELGAGNPDLVVVDVSWSSQKQCIEDYRR